MLVNPDLSLRAAVEPQQYRWVDSPQPGVERVMLDRCGGEKARATSIVRYAPGSHFPRHQHPGGEEILVLSGTFSEGGEHYPAGWYMRNPPGSSHQPSSEEGAVIFVKLWQMRANENRHVRIDTRDACAWTAQGGRASCLLFADQDERVSLEHLPAGARVGSGLVEGAEILVLDGFLHEGAHCYQRGSWIRVPAGEQLDFVAGDAGGTVYLKTGHLPAHTGEKRASC